MHATVLGLYAQEPGGGSMRSFLALAIAALALAIAPASARAQEASWRIITQAGNVWVQTPPDAPRVAVSNRSLPRGAVITTGADSQATLVNGRQRIEMSANSRMTVPGMRNGFERILQDMGSIVFDVDHRDTPHFTVDTPRLAAIVKGTRFTITVNDNLDSIAVESGLVEVHSRRGDDVENVATGEMAFVDNAAPTDLVLIAGLRGVDGARRGATAGAAPAGAAAIQPSGSPARSSGQAATGEQALGPGAPQVVTADMSAMAREAFGSNIAPSEAREQRGFLMFLGKFFGICIALGLGAFFIVEWTRSKPAEAGDQRRRFQR